MFIRSFTIAVVAFFGFAGVALAVTQDEISIMTQMITDPAASTKSIGKSTVTHKAAMVCDDVEHTLYLIEKTTDASAQNFTNLTIYIRPKGSIGPELQDVLMDTMLDGVVNSGHSGHSNNDLVMNNLFQIGIEFHDNWQRIYDTTVDRLIHCD